MDLDHSEHDELLPGSEAEERLRSTIGRRSRESCTQHQQQRRCRNCHSSGASHDSSSSQPCCVASETHISITNTVCVCAIGSRGDIKRVKSQNKVGVQGRPQTQQPCIHTLPIR
jgi:hypothetical protein